MRKLLRTGFLAAAAVGAYLAVSPVPAQATPISITTDPSLVGITGGAATYANMTIADYAIVQINNATGAWMEVANFNVTALDSKILGGINTTYQLFGTFVASGTSAFNGVIQLGSVTAMTVNLFGQSGTGVSFANPTTFSPATLADFGLGGTGATTKHLGTINFDGAQPNSVFADLAAGSGLFSAAGKVTKDAVNGAFWVSPDPATIALDAFIAATATSSVLVPLTATSCPAGDTCFQVGLTGTTDQGGGGNVTFQTVPEPSSIAILGMGLLGIGLWGWRRKAKA